MSDADMKRRIGSLRGRRGQVASELQRARRVLANATDPRFRGQMVRQRAQLGFELANLDRRIADLEAEAGK